MEPLKKNERLDDLQYKGLKIIQDKTRYCFTSDSVLLANFVKATSKDVVVDLCTGSGIIATLVLAKTNAKKIYGVELQPYLADMAKRSVKLNNQTERLEIINTSVQEVTNFIKEGSVSIVTANPPYEKAETHFLSGNDHIDICKYETNLSLKELIASASKLLKYGGKFYMVHKASRLAEIISVLKQFNLEPKIIKLAQPKQNSNANVLLIKAVKGGKQGVIVESTLILTDKNGNYTKELQKIYDGE